MANMMWRIRKECSLGRRVLDRIKIVKHEELGGGGLFIDWTVLISHTESEDTTKGTRERGGRVEEEN